MALIDVLNKNNIAVDLTVKSKKELISTIAELACKSPVLKNTDCKTVENTLWEREELASTGLGSGVAIPHCKLPGLSTFVVGVAITKKGIDFHAIDNEKVDIFPFVIGPEKSPKEHLKVLSGMARLLRNTETRNAMRKAGTADELFDLLKELLEDAPSTPSQTVGPGMRMLHVFVRDEEIFNDVLQVFASGEPIGAMVLEAHESTEYMSNIPIFAGLWNNDLTTFNRIILAVVKEKLLNQTLRSIEYVCGDLRKQTDVMVTVTDLHHALGSLDF
ncbi:MAG: PTS sugar transporter subunit IIA [Candidatus Fermentibacteria bacterium]|nr:PTS sugar transporter subunit IIA [Candidatus Fermentibacteria bacterium]